MAYRFLREAVAIFCLTVCVGVIIYVFLVNVCGVRFNLTPSAPVGVYIQSKEGSYLDFCPEGEAAQLSAERGYRSRVWFGCEDGRAALLKPIATRPGDIVWLSPDGIQINGHLLPDSAPLAKDRAGRPMKAYPFGLYQASNEAQWVVSAHPNGFDSRYYGPIAGGERLRFLFGW